MNRPVFTDSFVSPDAEHLYVVHADQFSHTSPFCVGTPARVNATTESNAIAGCRRSEPDITEILEQCPRGQASAFFAIALDHFATLTRATSRR
jgi:hypothetical protein